MLGGECLGAGGEVQGVNGEGVDGREHVHFDQVSCVMRGARGDLCRRGDRMAGWKVPSVLPELIYTKNCELFCVSDFE